ncbi:hypothetical protein [Spartinivicinus marinus]|uniref:hypothetical protein n=1 Tax=Spartinivicinus marinus TaxID=2994442 RepID=UPI00225BD069|nr:hypothetical protein [Spartinivicinus marinus]MCX4024745.1 hypothetical protein [Spartinivicinus marinus]
MRPISDRQYEQYNAYIEQKEDALADSVSTSEFISTTLDEHWISSHALRQLNRDDLVPDPSWVPSMEEYDQLINGIPEDLHDEFNSAVSRGHAFQIRNEILESLKRKETLMSQGAFMGISAGLAASIIDPGAWGMAVATEGLASPLLAAHKITRFKRILSSGLLTAASSATVEGYIASQDPTYDATDVLIGSAASFLMGASITGWRTRFAAKADEFRQAAELEEIRQAGGELSEAGKNKYKKLLNKDGSIPTPDERIAAIFEDGAERGTEFGKQRFDRAGINLSSDLDEVRGLSAALMSDALGGKKGELVKEAASVWKRMKTDGFMVAFYKSHNQHFNNFLRAEGISTVGSSMKHQHRERFNEMVTRYIRGEAIDNVHVKAHGDMLKDAYKRILSMAKKPQGDETIPNAVPVRGSEEVDFNEFYSPRHWSAAKIVQQIQQAGYTRVQHTIAGAFNNVEGEAALELAGAFIDIITTAKKGNVNLPQLNKAINENISEQLINDFGLDANKAAEIAKRIQKAIKQKDQGKTTRLKSRVDLDENKIADLLENDSELLFLNYSNTMLGHIALARQGIDSEGTFKTAMEKIEKKRAYNPGKTEAERTRHKLEIKQLYDAYNSIPKFLMLD